MNDKCEWLGVSSMVLDLEPDALALKLRISSGLEARYIVCRWREPPEYGKTAHAPALDMSASRA